MTSFAFIAGFDSVASVPPALGADIANPHDWQHRGLAGNASGNRDRGLGHSRDFIYLFAVVVSKAKRAENLIQGRGP